MSASLGDLRCPSEGCNCIPIATGWDHNRPALRGHCGEPAGGIGYAMLDTPFYMSAGVQLHTLPSLRA